ncbi:MAG: amylo-alpha-1,6-glucosidase [Candidatus Woesearchaeota archaeon]
MMVCGVSGQNSLRQKVPDEHESYGMAVDLLRKCSRKDGFIAAKERTTNGNYHRVWARDSMICGIAAIMSGEPELLKTMKDSLKTLMRFQHEQSEIPSNVNPETKGTSYGGTAGRVDAQLWFLIGFSQYVKKTKDMAFLRRYFNNFEKNIKLIRVYEFNHKNLIYVPKSGDWADEYVQEGYVLYDQILYHQAFKEYAYLLRKLGRSPKKAYEKAGIIKDTLQKNYWFKTSNVKHSYHRQLYERALADAKPFFMPFFNAAEYGKYFDLLANSLTILCGIATPTQARKIQDYVSAHHSLPPSFFPVITKKDRLWKELENNYRNHFRNKPHEYHNGGIWPMTLGFYAASKKKKGRMIYAGIQDLNRKNNWEFNEVYHGKTKRPHGTKFQAWSAAGAVIAYQASFNDMEVFL